MSPVLIVLILIAVLVPIFYFSYRFAKKRNAAIKQLAAEMNWEYVPEGDGPSVPGFSSLYLVAQDYARDKKIYNLISGQINGLNAAVFDFCYASGGESERITQTVAYVRSEHMDLPRFAMRPEGFKDKLKNLVGLSDINFPERPSFSRSYLLHSANEPKIRDVFNEHVLSFFENNQKLCVEGEGNTLIVYQDNIKHKPADFQANLQQAVTIINLLQGAEK